MAFLYFLSHFLSFRQGGHTADWNYSRPSNQTLKNWHVHDIYQQIQIRIDLLLQFPSIDKMWFSINMVLILIFSICPYALSRSEDSSFAFSAKLGLAIKSHSFLPKVAVFKGFRGHPMFALMPCFKRTLTLLLVLIIRIILSIYKFFPSSYAFFIISTWSSAVFAASIPLPPTMPFKEAFSKKEVPHHAPLLLLPLHTHLQVYQNCSLLEELSIWSILFLP